MTSSQLEQLAARAVSETLSHSNLQLGWDLPQECVHGIRMTQHSGIPKTLRESVEALLEKGRFPRIVDLAVGGLWEGKTLIYWIPTGDGKVNDIEQTWNQGYGPFKPVGVMSPKCDNFRLTPEELQSIGAEWIRSGSRYD